MKTKIYTSVKVLGLLLLAVQVFSCKEKATMVPLETGSLNKFESDSNLILIEILDTYESIPCLGNQKNANVYRVRLLERSDTIYIFETCQKMIWFKNPVVDGRKYPLAIEKSKDYAVEGLFISEKVHLKSNAKFIKGVIVQPII